MAGQAAMFHALLRPSVLQMLRATGYHSTKGAVLDVLTDLAARYLSVLCETTAAHATHNHGDAAAYTAVDVRIALQDVGALLPGLPPKTAEDMHGLDEFFAWFAAPRMKELMEMGRGDGESDATDYLTALKKKHSKMGQDTKYHGSIVGRPVDAVCDIQVEGGSAPTIDEWIMHRSSAYFAQPTNGHTSPSPSSGLGSHGGRVDGDAASKMDLEQPRNA